MNCLAEAMPVSLEKFLATEYHAFLAYGTSLRVTLRKNAVTRHRAFEEAPDFVDRLASGFELPPSLPLHAPDSREQIQVYAEPWARVTTTIYRFGGRIIYREVSAEDYEVTLELPPLWG